MKHFTRAIIAVLLAVLMGTLLPVQVFADTPDYISEVKVYMGDYSAAESEGYTLLKNGSNPVDLNKDAGGGAGSKGDKAVYLGYKTTKDRNEAITDLALMNMKGGYDVAEYEALFDEYIKSQINPLADKFVTMIKEYRQNYRDYHKNGRRARYVFNTLNKFIDDDSGKGIGDLFLEETRYEMGDEDYYAYYTPEQRKNIGDLVKILAQCNGKATLTIANLLLRACDTSTDETWIDRFAETTYDDLIDQTGLTPTDARKKLAKLYDDPAQSVLEQWDALYTSFDEYEDAASKIEDSNLEVLRNELEEKQNGIANFKNSDGHEDEYIAFIEAYNAFMTEYIDIMTAVQTVYIYEYLEDTDYDDGTLLDFFSRPSDEVETEEIYPMIAALTPGQKAGLEFVSLKELITSTITENAAYENAEYAFLDSISIYDGVDRGIYEKGGVALTTDARRADALKNSEDEKSMFSPWTITMMSVTGVATAALAVSAVAWAKNSKSLNILNMELEALPDYSQSAKDIKLGENFWEISGREERIIPGTVGPKFSDKVDDLAASTKLCKGLTIGLGIAAIILAGITTYLTWQEMKEYYKVEFSPIPHYMVDEKDIIGYNSKGEKIMLKNQSAYYKAVDCNRTEADEMFKTLGTCADMNGDVGQQWLALYAVKNELMEPILASSLKVVVDSAEMPAGYKTGVHMFGSEAAFNLNSSLYDWNNSAPSVYIYFKTDDSTASTTGANFTAGSLALAGGAGLVLGAAITTIASATIKKKEENKTAIA
jgi:hypothetical protein